MEFKTLNRFTVIIIVLSLIVALGVAFLRAY
jgi:hypothetical protein